MAGNNVIELTDATFDAAIADGATPILVDFWAEWCGPCRRMGPIVEELAGQYAGKLRVAKLNVDQHQQVAGKLSIQSIPALLIFKNGQLAKRIVGAVPKDMLDQAVQEVL
jgi:thioredoxin 1